MKKNSDLYRPPNIIRVVTIQWGLALGRYTVLTSVWFIYKI